MVVFKNLPRLVGALLIVLGFVAAAQTNASAQNDSEARAPASECTVPIGVTAAGELVFPFLCKDFIKRTHEDQAPPSAAINSARATEPQAETLRSETALKPAEVIPLPQPRPKRLHTSARKLISFADSNTLGHDH